MIKHLYRFLHPKFQNLFMEYKVNFVPRYGHGKPAHNQLLEIIDSNREQYTTLLKQALRYHEQIITILDSSIEKDATQPTWNNGFLPGLDIIGIYTMIATYKPKRFIEVGSGNSTKVAYKAKLEQHLEMKMVSIDPMPRAEIDSLVDTIIRKPLESCDLSFVNDLEENDILFIDNSHRILPNSDAMVFYLEVMPKLRPGVIVHIHDIYLPYDYPQFMCDRFYSEQYGLAMYLLANPKRYEVLLPNYFISEDPILSKIISSLWKHPNLQGVERHGGSFWFKVNDN